MSESRIWPPPSHPAPLKQPKRNKRQKESVDQRFYVKALNASGLGFFFRIKSMGTFDPTRGVFRKNSDITGIPDIIGYLKNGTAVFIECKHVEKVEAKKKLLFKVQIKDDQKQFLLAAYLSGCRAGVAFNLDDCLAIVHNQPLAHPRHPRTLCFLPEPELTKKAMEYMENKKALAKINQDPLARDILLSAEMRR